MYDPSSPKHYRDQSRDMQVLRSLQSPSLAKQNQNEPLLMRLLMLSIEIDRKDNIIRELLMASSNSQYEMQLQQMQTQCHKYELEIKTLTETVQMLKQNISLIESTKNKEVFNSLTHHFNEELENKVYNLEGRLRRAEEDKIALQEQLKQNKLNQSMVEYKLIRNEQSEKGRVRDLENQLITEKTKTETQRKAAAEKAAIIEQLKARLLQAEANERMLAQQYQQKIRLFQTELAYKETLKKSQINSTEEKITASAQEIQRLNEEVRYLRQGYEAERQSARNKEKEVLKVAQQNKQAQSKCIRLEGELREATVRLESRTQELRLKEKQIAQKEQQIRRLSAEGEEVKLFFTNKNEEIQIYVSEVARLNEQLSQLMLVSDQQRNQLRKLKRKPLSQGVVLCQSCKLKETGGGSASLIASQKSIRALNIDDIIQQTEQLFRSNRKIQSLITRHESNCDSSIHLYNDNQYQQ